MKQPLTKTFGGKWYQRKHIIAQFPNNYEQLTYIEPYLGGGSVLLEKKPSIKEIANDLNPALMDLWEIVKYHSDTLQSVLKGIEYNKENFQSAKNNEFGWAPLNEYIVRRMSRGGLGKHFAWSKRLRGGIMGELNSWQNAIKNLSNISARIQKVEFRCEKALDVINEFKDDPNALFYIDCPYLHETRYSKTEYGIYEMSEADHIELGELLNSCKGKIIVSGYPSTVYDKLYDSWRVIDKEIVNHASQKKKKDKKIERLWANYAKSP